VVLNHLALAHWKRRSLPSQDRSNASSTALRLSVELRTVAGNLSAAAAVLMMAGCGGQASSTVGQAPGYFSTAFPESSAVLAASSQLRSNQEGIVLDSGVVFANEACYVCFPLSRLGISQASRVRRIISSCECVRPSLVRYHDHLRQEMDALRLDFVPEGKGTANSGHVPYQSSLLSVEVRLELASGDERKVTVNFLQTLPVGEDSNAEEERDE
jgi:hypothetical protein